MLYNKTMGIVTKRGYQGKTSLFLGGAVAKNNPRVEMDGTLDELCSQGNLTGKTAKRCALRKTLRSFKK